ncbi:hypothetical protein ACVIJX_007977 [Bradyrhizobium diazoefficiens]
MAEADHHGASETFRWKRAALRRRRAPPQERSDHGEIAQSIDPEGGRDAEPADDGATQRRPDGSADVDAYAVAGHGRGQVLPRDKLRDNRLPCGRGERSAGAEQKREQQKDGRSDEVKPDEHRTCCRDDCKDDFTTNQKTAFVDSIRQRASRQREQEHRKAARDLNQGDGEGIGIEAGHQPSGRSVVHPGADVGDDGCDPDNRERGVPKRDPRGSVGHRRRWIRLFVG